MNDIYKIYRIIATVLGAGLIIGIFLLFGEPLDGGVLTLDIIASLIVYLHVVHFFFFPLIDLRKQVHKEAGMLGIHFVAAGGCCTLSILTIVAGIILDLPFLLQLIIQLVLLFLLIVARVATLLSGKKIEGIHAEEKRIMDAKGTLTRSLDDFLDNEPGLKSLNAQELKTLLDLKDALRYLAPSSNAEAKQAESQFTLLLNDLRVMLRNPALNGEKISECVSNLQKTYDRRRNIS